MLQSDVTIRLIVDCECQSCACTRTKYYYEVALSIVKFGNFDVFIGVSALCMIRNPWLGTC